jgi:Flp pilus assembly CpaF family ATPase
MHGFELILPFLRPIQHLILDPAISEIMVNGPERIFIEKAGYLQAVPGVRLTPESLIVAVKNIARRLGDDISEAKPILDSRLPDGSRVAAVIPPCSVHGVALTIRKFNSHKFKMNDLIERGTVTPDVAKQLEEFVVQRKNILICGGTASGKTTLANILMEFIPNRERMVLIEDTAEIQIQKENVLRFEARREQNGLPAVTIRDLLKATLRHRPDRIIVGEIRGGEAFDLLQLLNTGHSGTISTIHANSAAQGISRFTTCVLQSGIDIPYRAIKTNIADSLNILVQMERRPGRRYVSEATTLRLTDMRWRHFPIVQTRVAPWHRHRKTPAPDFQSGPRAGHKHLSLEALYDLRSLAIMRIVNSSYNAPYLRLLLWDRKRSAINTTERLFRVGFLVSLIASAGPAARPACQWVITREVILRV